MVPLELCQIIQHRVETRTGLIYRCRALLLVLFWARLVEFSDPCLRLFAIRLRILLLFEVDRLLLC